MGFNTINIAVCSLIVLCISVMTLNNVCSSQALDSIEFSVENFINGRLVLDINNSIDKNIIARENIIHFSDKIKGFKGFNLSDDIVIVNSDGINVNVALFNPQAMETDWGRIIVYDRKGLEVCTFNEDASQKYVDAVNQLASHANLNINLMLIPTQIEFVDNSDVQSLSYSQKSSIDFVYHQLDARINAIDVYKDLKAHTSEYIYFKTDHHWTSLGAYYGYTSFIKSAGKKPFGLDIFEEKTSVPFIGSLYTLTNSKLLLKNPDVVVAYKPKANYIYQVFEEGQWIDKELISNYYLNKEEFAYEAFLGGDFTLSKITTESAESGSIVILKDSYANAMIPFLVPHYRYIYIIDPRSYDDDFYAFIEEHSIEDILIVNYALVNRFTGYADFYTNLFK